MRNVSWSFSTAFQSLPPLASLQMAGHPPSDPAEDMLAAVRAAGGCLEFSGRYDDRWVVMRAGGGVLRYPSPVGHRLVTAGHICRHPLDIPGKVLRFARFIPRERMPPGFVFAIWNDAARPEEHSKLRDMTQEEFNDYKRERERRRAPELFSRHVKRTPKEASPGLLDW